MTDGGKILLASGIGLAVLALVAWASPAQSKVLSNKPLPPPPGRPAAPPPGTQEAIAAAIAAATAAAQGTAPMNPNVVNPGAAGMLLPNPALLLQGRRYKARLELSGLEKLGSREQIKGSFEELGFANVTVYMSSNELPANWPVAARANITGGSRWAEGTWNQPSQSVERPSQIQNAWTA